MSACMLTPCLKSLLILISAIDNISLAYAKTIKEHEAKAESPEAAHAFCTQAAVSASYTRSVTRVALADFVQSQSGLAGFTRRGSLVN